MPITVPNVIGLFKRDAEKALDDLRLRPRATFPFDASGNGKAASQSPGAGTLVEPFEIVTVSYPSSIAPVPRDRLGGGVFRMPELSFGAQVAVPDIVGLAAQDAEKILYDSGLRYIPRFTFDASGTGKAAAQSPAAGTVVPSFTIVKVDYPSPLGPLPDGPVDGPKLPAGTYDSRIVGVMVGNPWGTGQGAWVEFSIQVAGAPVSFRGQLYFDRDLDGTPHLPRNEWMRRGAILGVAQRALTNGHTARLMTTIDSVILSMEILTS